MAKVRKRLTRRAKIAAARPALPAKPASSPPPRRPSPKMPPGRDRLPAWMTDVDEAE
jgi:hypothetical protein